MAGAVERITFTATVQTASQQGEEGEGEGIVMKNWTTVLH